MQILVPRCCGRVLFYNTSLIQSRNPSISSSFVAYFRSTPTSFEKWENKWNNSSDFKGPQPSKTYIKYKTRQKRADAKKALNDLFFRSGYSKFTLGGGSLKKRQGVERLDGDPTDRTGDRKKGDPLKSSAHRTSKGHQKRHKSKPKKGIFFEEFDDDPGMHFQATFGNRWYSWSFKSWEESFSQSQTSGFEWREDSNGTNSRSKWRTASDDESDDDKSYAIGSHSDRVTLGLPTNGPLKIDEVKNAFRLSALKWHPDKHQGPSQAMAEDKFKVCVSAYKSLCNALSTA
ncbi:hypothetical protein L6452_40369 [Arctium lappa]|uniref:Uncharacterized protein n=1 Tax=Arctium lappa TaxID=4217 RepID=A0ACB8XMA8_ARCLA|nr:hypothetical protein L6452_40369 [Arctium lappa]